MRHASYIENVIRTTVNHITTALWQCVEYYGVLISETLVCCLLLSCSHVESNQEKKNRIIIHPIITGKLYATVLLEREYSKVYMGWPFLLPPVH